jgi:hypothetical protein
VNLNKWVLAGVVLFMTPPMWAGTYYGGFEDAVGGDYDYNDMVFRIIGATLLQGGGLLLPKPLLDDSGTPFWNNRSLDTDHDHDNIGYCVYGFAADAGTCADHSDGLSSSALYLATPGGSVNDVTFLPGGAAGSVLLTITANSDDLGWYDVATPGTIHFFNLNGGTATDVAIEATGAFGLVATKSKGKGVQIFYSQTALGNAGDSVSHFAFFTTAAPAYNPEPATTGLFGSALAALGFWARRKRR